MKPISTWAATVTPLLDTKDYAAASVFRADNLLREARRQKALAAELVPDICVLDPDGDIIRFLRQASRAETMPGWACYHTELFVTVYGGLRFGLIGCAVGAPFAVLLAEQLFASGCRLLLSLTSAGQVVPIAPTPYFVLIDRALRDEGTSYHYLPPDDFAAADTNLADRAMAALANRKTQVHRGATWTTDAPFRETEAALERARSLGVLGVEMEAAALYAFAIACRRPVLCFAYVTNQMAQIDGDFEKGEANGAADALELLATVARACVP